MSDAALGIGFWLFALGLLVLSIWERITRR